MSLKSKKTILIFGLISSLVITNIIFYPFLVHFFDFKSLNTNIYEISNNKPNTRNLTLNGKFLVEYAITEDTKNKSLSKNKNFFYIPVVENDWTVGEKVKIVAKFNKNEFQKLIDAIEKNEASGILKNVLWENQINSEIEKNFAEQGIFLDSKCSILDIEEQKTNKQNGKILLIFDIIFVILLTIFSATFFSKNKKYGNL